MFCSKCGKAISDQARFCNYCGNPVNAPQPQVAPAPAKKKGKTGSTMVTILVALVVYFGVRFATEYMLTGDKKDAGSDTNTSIIQNQDSNFEQGFKEALAEDPDVRDAMGSCFYGGLYQNGSLRYGLTRLSVPGYSLLAGEGDERDWLISPDGACLLAVYRQPEILDISYDASTEEGLLDSYKQSYSDAAMISFEKLYVDGFPVIRYIVGYTANDTYQYQGELIVFPSETTDETIRLAMFVDVARGYGADDIHQILDTLEVSPDFRVKAEETGVMGLNRITVK